MSIDYMVVIAFSCDHANRISKRKFSWNILFLKNISAITRLTVLLKDFSLILNGITCSCLTLCGIREKNRIDDFKLFKAIKEHNLKNSKWENKLNDVPNWR